MKREKHAYLVSLDADDIGAKPVGLAARPVFVQAWSYRGALELAADEVIPHTQLNSTLKVVRLRRLRPVDHVTNPWRKFYVNRKAVITHVVPA
jgi:hypothetical protein